MSYWGRVGPRPDLATAHGLAGQVMHCPLSNYFCRARLLLPLYGTGNERIQGAVNPGA